MLSYYLQVEQASTPASGHGLATSLQIVSVKRRGEHYLESMWGVSEKGPGWVWYVEYTKGMGVWMHVIVLIT